jgi:hypothetical protein
MNGDIPLILTSLLLGLFCVVGLVEHSLYGGFQRGYYTHGLPFVIREIPVSDPHQDIPHQDIPPVSVLEGQFRSALLGSLTFQQIAPNTYGFRRRFFQSALVPNNLIHGMLLFDRENGRVVLKGFVNMLVPVLVLAVGVFSVLGPFPGLLRLLPLVLTGLIIGIPLVMERRRCEKLALFAASAWTTIPEKIEVNIRRP